MNQAYKTKVSLLTGTDYREIGRKAHALYNRLASKTKRKPYIRSVYFDKEKIFLDYFWQHLQQKNRADRFRRLKLYACALDTIMHSRIPPIVSRDPNNNSESLYRFTAISQEGITFCVQIKEIGRQRNKHFISVFPT